MTYRERWATRKSQINALAQQMCVRTAQEDGDAIISGRRGTIHDLTLDGGFSVAYFGKNACSINATRILVAELGGTMVAEGVDGECVFDLPTLPSRQGATKLRNLLKVPKIFEFTPDALRRKQEAAKKARKSLMARPAAKNVGVLPAPKALG